MDSKLSVSVWLNYDNKTDHNFTSHRANIPQFYWGQWRFVCDAHSIGERGKKQSPGYSG